MVKEKKEKEVLGGFNSIYSMREEGGGGGEEKKMVSRSLLCFKPGSKK